MAASDITCSGLTATGDVKGVKLAWSYSDPRSGALPNLALDMVEVWAATSNDRAHGSFAKVGEGITDFLHAGLNRGDVRYYWIKVRDNLGGYGGWHPSGATSGVQGTEVSGDIDVTGIDGYWKTPSGLMFQWGKTTADANGDATVTFSTNFPTDILQFVATPETTGAGVAEVYSINWHSKTLLGDGSRTLGIKCKKVLMSGGVAVVQDAGSMVFAWIAIGY